MPAQPHVAVQDVVLHAAHFQDERARVPAVWQGVAPDLIGA